MQEQWAGSSRMRKKELLISTDDIPTAEEAVYLSDSRRAGKISSIIEWKSPMRTSSTRLTH